MSISTIPYPVEALLSWGGGGNSIFGNDDVISMM